jgi:hypothetical protein
MSIVGKNGVKRFFGLFSTKDENDGGIINIGILSSHT